MDLTAPQPTGHTASSVLAPDLAQLWQQINRTDTVVPATTVAELAAHQARTGPDRPAVVSARRRLTYGEVFARAQAVAATLQQATGTSVAVCVEPGWEQVVAILATSLAGRPFCVVEPDVDQPARWQRLAEMDAEVILTQSWLAERLRWPGTTTLLMLDQHEADSEQPISAAASGVATGDQPWCLLPPPRQGDAPVVVSHEAMTTTITGLCQRLDIGERDRSLVVSRLSDPATLFAITALFSVGGTVVVPDDVDLHNPATWYDLMYREQVTVWQATPTLTAMLVDHLHGRGEPAPEALRFALIGGEPLPVALAVRLRAAAGPQLRIVNLCAGGPAGVWVASLEVGEGDPAGAFTPVGAPLPNKRVYVLNEDTLTPCPVWVTGRICVGGRGTAAAPGRAVAGPAGEKLHRTDLLGRVLPGGVLDVVGEDATSTTISGHPLNLRDVEGRLASHPAVSQAVVIPHGGGSVAFVRACPGATVTGVELLEHLRKKMSPYLLPHRVELASMFALTPDGRVDRETLARAAGSRDQSLPVQPAAAAATGATVAASDLMERASRLAAEVLGIADVEPDLNLLDLGATSVQLVRLATRVEQDLGLTVDVAELLRFPSVAVLVNSAGDGVLPPAEPAAGPPAGPELILDPVERVKFKDRQPGIRDDLQQRAALELESSDVRPLLRRRTSRRFSPATVPLGSLAALLSVLRRLDAAVPSGPVVGPGGLPADPKYAYPSAGGLYPIQTYLTVSRDRVDDLPEGGYYYHPVRHRLITTGQGFTLADRAHAWINREAFLTCAFSLYLVCDRDAIDPMYGDRARDYSLIEAGAMCQLLMTAAAELGLGLCPIGDLDDTTLREPLQLAAGRHEVLHVLLGGRPDDGVA